MTPGQATTTLPDPVSGEDGARRPDPHVIVLFGATGDLAARKLIPGLFHLDEAGLLPDEYRIVGTSADDYDTESFREHARKAIDEFGRIELADGNWDRFCELLEFVPVAAGGDALGKAVKAAAGRIEGDVRLLHYLAVPPSAFGDISNLLAGERLTGANARVIIEKPFGYDLETARELNATMHRAFDEQQIFRIDHFLGKEGVQNVLALRFANGLYEPIWNRTNVEFVQIDIPETLSIGHRGGFYEKTGAYRDMIVTHLLQLLSFIAMEPPVRLTAEAIREEKQKVFDAIRPLRPEDVVRGQYEGYRDAEGVAPDSDTETFIAAKVEIDNWRWSGVPFFLRTGKCMPETQRLVALDLREPPMAMFPDSIQHQGANQLVFDFSEPGSIVADFQAKVPGPTLELGPARMVFDYDRSFCADNQLEAYERLIHDAMLGDQTLFNGSRGIERLWEVSMPVLDDMPPLHSYPQNSWGPKEADELIEPWCWRLPEADRSGEDNSG